MINRTDEYRFEYSSNDITLLSEQSLKDIWDNDIEDEAWKDL
jgi:hypothetical protein